MTGLSPAKRRELAYELSVLLTYLPPSSAAAEHTRLACSAMKDSRIIAARDHVRSAIDADSASADIQRRRRMTDIERALSAATGDASADESPRPTGTAPLDRDAVADVIAEMEHYDDAWHRELADYLTADGDIDQDRMGAYESAKDDHAWPVLFPVKWACRDRALNSTNHQSALCPREASPRCPNPVLRKSLLVRSGPRAPCLSRCRTQAPYSRSPQRLPLQRLPEAPPAR